MATTDKESSAAGTDNCPPMLEESDFESWKIRIERYIRGKPLGKLIWKSLKCPYTTSNNNSHYREGEQKHTKQEKTDDEFTEQRTTDERADIHCNKHSESLAPLDTSSTHSIKPRRQKRFGRMWSYSCKDLDMWQRNARRRNEQRTHSGSKTRHCLWKLRIHEKGAILGWQRLKLFLAELE
ncbi:hypothetical protein Tco_0255432 [Tanacetum coccineum]